MDYNIDAELLRALENDGQLDFKRINSKYMNNGICPACGQRELFISVDQPYVLKCNRSNQCGYSEKTRDRYPELYSNFSQRFPSTPENRNATAEAYMRDGRGFPLSVIGSWFSQEKHHHKGLDRTFDTVRFYFDSEKTRYWERLIDCNKDDDKQRHNISGARKKYATTDADHQDYNNTLYKGECWTPPGQVIEHSDTVWWVEGIFHAIALHLAGKKVIAAIAANNYPELFLRDYFDKKITWIIALDDDKAGHEYTIRHRKKLLGKQQTVQVAHTGAAKADWDDLYKEKKLDDDFFKTCIWRGQLFTAESIKELAWLHYQNRGLFSTVLPFKNRWWSVKTNASALQTAISDAKVDITSTDGFDKFKQFTQTEQITNCLPEFIYCEQNVLTGEIGYFFQIDFPHAAPKTQVVLPGSAVESPGSFNKALLNTVAGATFDGEAWQMKRLRERWFNHEMVMVKTVPFAGYDKDSRAYLFQGFAYHEGKLLKPTEHAYFNAGKNKIKTTFRGFIVKNSTNTDTNWFNDFYTVFLHNGVATMAFWLGSLFAEQIREIHESFLFLEMTGKHGTGKSTLIEFLWACVGRDDYEGFDPSKSTFAARARSFTQVANLPVVLIEGDREDDKAKKAGFDFEELKTAYNGRAIRSTGAFTRGNETEEPPFRAAICIAQNAEVDGTPALLSRIVHLPFTSGHFTAESRRLAKKFTKPKSEQFGGFLHAALRNEKAILETYSHHFELIEKQFDAVPHLRDPRIVKVHAQLAALCQCLPIIFPTMKADLCGEMTAFLMGRAKSRQSRMESDHPVVQKFWELYSLLNTAGEDGGVYQKETLNHSSNSKEIAISIPHFQQIANKQRAELPNENDLKKLLPASRVHKFIEIKTVRSKLMDKKTVKCWIFEAESGEAT